MKLKTLFVLSFTLLIVFLIYLSHIDKKVYYVALGDYQALGVTNEGIITYGYSDYLKDRLKTNNKLETYLIGYAKDNARITDVINDIEQNRELKIKSRKQTLKNALIKADLITLSIGMNDLFYKIGVNHNLEQLNYNELYYHVDEMMEDMEKLFKLLREYCKEDIIITNFYNPTNQTYTKLEDVLTYANNRLEELSNYYDIEYIKVDDIFKTRKTSFENIYPTTDEYKKISKRIETKMNQILLNK